MDATEKPEFADLPKATQEFLLGLREAELKQLAEAIEFMRSIRLVGKFTKWLIITIVGTFMGAVALSDTISKLFSATGGAGR